jgi:hypothetical protein
MKTLYPWTIFFYMHFRYILIAYICSSCTAVESWTFNAKFIARCPRRCTSLVVGRRVPRGNEYWITKGCLWTCWRTVWYIPVLTAACGIMQNWPLCAVTALSSNLLARTGETWLTLTTLPALFLVQEKEGNRPLQTCRSGIAESGTIK